MTPEQQEQFDEIYRLPPIEACKKVVKMGDIGIYDERDTLQKGMMMCRAIVELARRIGYVQRSAKPLVLRKGGV